MTVLDLSQGWLEALDSIQYLVPEAGILDFHQDLLNHVVSVLVVDELLDDEVNSALKVLVGSEEGQLVQNLEVVVHECAFEDLFDHWLITF